MKFGIYILCIENFMKRYPDYHLNFGWGNGYILIPRNHPFYEKDNNNLNAYDYINAHGGLTIGDYFSNIRFLEWIEDREIAGDVTKENFEKFDKYWMIGFDSY